jgi:tetratricopeptide (TPR) repeat protein
LEADAIRLLRVGELAEALAKAKSATIRARTLRGAHGLHVLLLLQQGRKEESTAAFDSAVTLPVDSADACDALAYAAKALGRHEDANRLYHATVALAPRTPGFWYNVASSDRSFGRLVEAEAACDRAIALDAAQYPSYLLRAEVRVQSPTCNHVAELKALLSDRTLSSRGRMFLAYALGKELDDLGRYDEAFGWFATGARTRRQNLSYDVAVDELKIARICEEFKKSVVLSSASLFDSGRYIFVVGLPRSGTTLVERILTGLPGVRSVGETDNFARALVAATPPGAGDLFARARAVNPVDVADQYRQLAGAGSVGCKILEKLPMNYLYLGAIRRALPGARLIWVRRSPLDTCLAMYRTLFGKGYPFSYDFQELARYFAAYARLMSHWRTVLEDSLFEISYEQLVADPASVGAAMAASCDLQWKHDAIHVQHNASVSLTASASQVRRPIYGSSSGKWRSYRNHLAPLISAMRKHDIPLPPEAI